MLLKLYEATSVDGHEYLLERHGWSLKEEAEVEIIAWPKASNTTTHGNILPPDLCTLRKSGGTLQGKDGSAGGKVWRGQRLRFPLYLVLPSFIYICSIFHLVHLIGFKRRREEKKIQTKHRVPNQVRKFYNILK